MGIEAIGNDVAPEWEERIEMDPDMAAYLDELGGTTVEKREAARAERIEAIRADAVAREVARVRSKEYETWAANRTAEDHAREPARGAGGMVVLAFVLAGALMGVIGCV